MTPTRALTSGRGCLLLVATDLVDYDRVKRAARLETERPHALREAIMSCRNGGIVSIMGVYGRFMDKFPIGSLMNRSLTIKTGQTHVHHCLRTLLERFQNGEIDPSSRSRTIFRWRTPRRAARC